MGGTSARIAVGKDVLEAHRIALTDLKERLQLVLSSVVPADRAVLYLDYPVHSNVGDWLILLGTEAWIQQSGLEVGGRWNLYNFRFPPLPADATILCHGGGNLGDLYRHQRLREAVVEAYPDHRIVFLPQTIYFGDPAKLRASARLLAGHPDLHILLRDRESLETARARMPQVDCRLAPDMAAMLHPLDWSAGAGATKTPARLCLMRRDLEASSTQRPAGPCGWQGDWRRLLGPWYPLIRSMQGILVLGSAGWPADRAASTWLGLVRRAARHCAQRLAGAELVETSRLHGHILAGLLGVPSRLHDNRYGKNSAYFRAWSTSSRLAELVSD